MVPVCALDAITPGLMRNGSVNREGKINIASVYERITRMIGTAATLVMLLCPSYRCARFHRLSGNCKPS
jgi:hypothetical protein